MNGEFIKSLGFTLEEKMDWADYNSYYAIDNLRNEKIWLRHYPYSGRIEFKGWSGGFGGTIRHEQDLINILKMTGVWDEIHSAYNELMEEYTNKPLLKYLTEEEYFPIKDNLDLK